MPSKAQLAARKRAEYARREAVAPRVPAAAMNAYQDAMAGYAERVAAAARRELGRKDGPRWDVLQAEFDRLALGMARSVGATGRRVSTFAKAEARRLLKRRIPPDLTDTIMVDEFLTRNLQLIRDLGRRQLAYLQGADEPLRMLWVSRVQGQTIARDQVHRFGRETVERWCTASGEEEFVYHVRRDGRERDTHRANDGKRFRAGQRPATLDEPNCRCCLIPSTALKK